MVRSELAILVEVEDMEMEDEGDKVMDMEVVEVVVAVQEEDQEGKASGMEDVVEVVVVQEGEVAVSTEVDMAAEEVLANKLRVMDRTMSLKLECFSLILFAIL